MGLSKPLKGKCDALLTILLTLCTDSTNWDLQRGSLKVKLGDTTSLPVDSR